MVASALRNRTGVEPGYDSESGQSKLPIKMDIQLGKLPKKDDPRNFKSRGLYRVKVPIPEAYDFERRFNGTMTLLDQNNYNACTVYAAASCQMRFEFQAQKKMILFSNECLMHMYHKVEQGNDGGAYMLDVLKLWRREGIPCYQKDDLYRINAFLELERTEDDLKRAIYTFGVVYTGIAITSGMLALVESGEPIMNLPSNDPVQGGHAIAVDGYDANGFTLVHTWAVPQRRQWIEKGLFIRYCDEAYSMVDELPEIAAKSLKLKKLRLMLEAL